ncbi:type I secretion system permease/ATPase [Sphingobium sp. Cam5-1]|uniref:type I secretion system permease/ATPase n=1 Tax=Sphingobium sp. Cam5-1 TaxID=2789327 RepID=UPI001E517E9A|nr:type I secretion system permease/ATPase [Sphingobium sp. Cam5-1]
MAVGRREGELWDIVRSYKKVFIVVLCVSAILNVLLLGSSLYMMMVYDSVLPSRSIPTLVGLAILIMIVYAFQGFFENMRSGMLADVANSLEQQLSGRVQSAISQLALAGHKLPGDGLGPMRDLENVRAFLSGGASVMIDLPWIIFFLGVLFALHVWLGFTTLIGAIILFSLTLVTNRVMKQPAGQLSQLSAYRNNVAETNLRHVELLTALGMRGRMQQRWGRLNNMYGAAQNKLARSGAALGGLSKMLRLALQSMILTVGALLVLDDKASAGVIFASSILSARALAPVDQAIANWKSFMSARSGWATLTELLKRVPAPPQVSLRLPPPAQKLSVEKLAIAPPGTRQITANGVEFQLSAGDACAVIGPSGAGKSSLARALIGAWRPARGTIRFDGASLDQWNAEDFGGFVGYLPQSVELLDGTIAENIARFDPSASSEAVLAAAKAAAVHDLITRLPQGYDTRVGADGEALSGGQRQRIGLARALYGDPFFVLLDEPNSNLDSEGEAALAAAIETVRNRGGILVVISHRADVLGRVSHVMVMRGGRMEAFGPAAQIMARLRQKPKLAQENVVAMQGAAAGNS